MDGSATPPTSGTTSGPWNEPTPSPSPKPSTPEASRDRHLQPARGTRRHGRTALADGPRDHGDRHRRRPGEHSPGRHERSGTAPTQPGHTAGTSATSTEDEMTDEPEYEIGRASCRERV